MPSTLAEMIEECDQLLTQVEAAKHLKLKNPHTLAVWRCTQRYDLKYIKMGRLIRYRLEDLDKFLEAQVVRSTSID